jgi:hypothetical protein
MLFLSLSTPHLAQTPDLAQTPRMRAVVDASRDAQLCPHCGMSSRDAVIEALRRIAIHIERPHAPATAFVSSGATKPKG